jgi:CheY-like chemotaxis protein
VAGERAPDGKAAPLPALDGVRVVAVDDNTDAAAIMAAALTCAGADVETFTSPAEALSAWASRPGHVLVCDLAMPHMSGLELLGRIRQLDSSRGVFTPAIAVSAHASEQHHADSLKGGFQLHLPKPLQQDDLIRAVARAVAKA